MRRRGFTLIEMVIVLAISAMMLGFAFQSSQLAANDSQNCYTSTGIQIEAIRGAIENFARGNDRLPLPAARNVGIDSLTYGREDSGAGIDSAGGVSFGALPFQALGLPSSYAGDCWGNKFTYAVTTALTTNAASGGFLDTSVLGNMTIKTDASTNFSTTAAYAIISHGEDELGAVKLNYFGAGHGWCSGTALSQLNCAASAATLVNAAFNNGKDAGANYFDDLVVASGKPQSLVTATSPATYCWGANTAGRVGDGTTTNSLIPTKVIGSDVLPTVFQKVITSSVRSCGLTSAGEAYCWGGGKLGDGTTANQSVPTKVSGTGVAPLVFTDIATNAVHTCGLTATGAAYCWGDNTYGQLGDGTTTQRLTPTLVTGSGAAPFVFTRISLGMSHTCGLVGSGATYCWGDNTFRQIGDGTTIGPRLSPTLVGGTGSAPRVFASITSAFYHNCGLTATGAAYCWGMNGGGQLGTGSFATYTTAPLVLGSGSAPKIFSQIDAQGASTCAVTTDGAAYCWGSNAFGQIGDGTTTTRNSPTLVTGSGSAPLVFIKLSIQAINATCAQTAAGTVYCWGENSAGEVGDGTGTDRYTPTLVSGSGVSPLSFTDIGGNCGITN